MSLIERSEEVANTFAKLILRRKWAEAAVWLSSPMPMTDPAAHLTGLFEWKALRQRLRSEWMAETGEGDDMVPALDPPKRFEVFAMEDEAAPDGLESGVDYCWIEIDFQPAEDSEFDACYNCHLAFVDVSDQPRIVAIRITNAN